MNDPALIDRILTTARTIAVVGMSDKTHRDSYHVGQYLATQGYRILPVNPSVQAIDGRVSHPDLAAAQAAVHQEFGAGIDVVDVFRASPHVPQIVDEVIRLGIPYLWLQDGVMHPEAVERARAAGVQCVVNDCMLRQHRVRRFAAK